MTRQAPCITANGIIQDLGALGVDQGQALMVHSSLGSLGRVFGGAPAVVRALLAALSPAGTLVMPAEWSSWVLESGELERARVHVSAFDAATTPMTLGLIPETFRRWPGVLRGPHPQVSICALGPRAAEIVASHPLK